MSLQHHALQPIRLASLLGLFPGIALAADSAPKQEAPAITQVLNVRAEDMRWQKFAPEMGERSSEFIILRVDKVNQITQLMIRVPKNSHVPAHWHKANETHTIMSGTFIMKQGDTCAVLGPGSYNYIPARTVHEAWTRSDEGVLLFITMDGDWDMNMDVSAVSQPTQAGTKGNVQGGAKGQASPVSECVTASLRQN